MSKAVRIHEVGGADRLLFETIDTPTPGPGEVLLRQSFAGVNYVDVYHRTGLYPLAGLPAVLGVEGAGVVEALGPNVTGLAVGDRVAYAAPFTGGYASVRTVPAERVMRLTPGVHEDAAAASMLRGITTHMLLGKSFPVREGTTVLVHAAAGGLGLILTQWAKLLGATVIGTVGSRQKADRAIAVGLDHAILYREENFVDAVREITDGKGVDVAYDGIGGETLIRTLDAVRPFGTVASIGQSGGPIPPIDVSMIGPRLSLSLARPSSFAYMNDVPAYRQAATEFLSLVENGSIRIDVDARYPLAEAARAHSDLEARRTAGAILLHVASLA
jgi:NADPH2:quinone reductase